MSEAAVLKNIIESRKSVFPKNYSDIPIEKEILAEILGSANFSPNHKKTKPWRLKIFQGTEKDRLGEKLAEIYKATVLPESFLEKKHLDIPHKISKSDALITICVNFSSIVPEWEEIAATAMAVQNMYLTATANKIGCYWSTPKMIEHLHEFLHLEHNQKCIGLFYLGNICD
jgi:nitroreductase